MVAREEGVGEGEGAGAADGGLHGAADGAARQAEQRRRVAAVVGARDDEVDGPAVLEEVEEAQLGGSGRRAVDEDPFFFVVFSAGIPGGTGLGVRGPVIPVQGAGAEVGRFDDLRGEVGFGDPGTLLMGQDDGDGVAGGLQRLYERVDVRRGLLMFYSLDIVCFDVSLSVKTYLIAWGPVVIRDEDVHPTLFWISAVVNYQASRSSSRNEGRLVQILGFQPYCDQFANRQSPITRVARGDTYNSVTIAAIK